MFLNVFGQCATRHIGHDDVWQTILLTIGVDWQYVRMIKLTRGFGFA